MSMEHEHRYTVTVYLAAPGTPLRDGNTSLSGHMYLQVSDGVNHDSYGFGAGGHDAAGAASAGAEVSRGDAVAYQDPYYARTLEISRAHYDSLRVFGADPRQHGFDMAQPFAANRCSDFAWAALDHAGIHSYLGLGAETVQESAFSVLFNLPEIQSIRPPFPASPLNAERHHPLPGRDVAHRPLSAPVAPPAPETTRPLPTVITPADPMHPDHGLLAQVSSKVAELDAANGRTFDATSERISANLLALAKQNNLSRVDHVLLSTRTEDAHAAQKIFIVQGDRDDPAHLRASMPTEVAAKPDADAASKRGK
ncbi:XVIPCD domain-containing protein [Stenotrophomonas rhizophila]|uniref:XVIPCD domain-containing protein n=1 Tax=Stenotrophomonas rhizophila TaxID=216778 RepID=UPI001E5FEC15|nr:XVIPCD domain-containing protein [Stenotrophomonas rhizophila]